MNISFKSDIYSKRIKMDAGEIISLILKGYKERNRNMPSFVGNDSNTSFYISMKRGKDKCPVQIRLSNHGTYLRTWVDRTNLENSNERLQDPSHCINISIVFIDDGKDLTNDCEGQTNCDNCQITPCIPQTFDGQNDLGHPFQVQQYTYCSRTIRKRYLKGIVGAIIRALRTGKYTDPLSKVTKRKAANKTLDSSYPITPHNNKTDKNESKNMNRKNTIRLTESELKRVITESVKNILKEQQDGNVTDNPIINQLWNELMSINQGLIKDILQKYGWGKSKELGNGVFKQIVKVSEAINTFDAVLRNRTADSDYWAMSAHEQD